MVHAQIVMKLRTEEVVCFKDAVRALAFGYR